VIHRGDPHDYKSTSSMTAMMNILWRSPLLMQQLNSRRMIT
jgi:hypothetical protein